MTQVSVDQAIRIALQHHQNGRPAEAEAIYRQVLAAVPNHPDALNLLGLLAQQAGHREEAARLIKQAIAAMPKYAMYHSNLGEVLRSLGQLDEAVAAFSRAIELKPDYAEAYSNLGNALKNQGKFDEAVAAYSKAIELKHDFAEAYTNLGTAYREQEKFNEALAAHTRAIELKPGYAEAHSNLGNALLGQWRLEEAAMAYSRSLEIKPDLPEVLCNLGTCVKELGRLDEAIAVSRRAIELKADLAEAHAVLAYALLLKGDFAGGLPEYEWRWRCRDFNSPPRGFAQPQWDGGPLCGRTILLHGEQGFGDAIQFIRYAPLIAARGGRVVLECRAELCALFRTLSGVEQIIPAGEPLPAFDLHCPLLSLPLAFSTRLGSIPADVPYLRPDSYLVETWRKKIGPRDGRFRVGLAWAGNPTFLKDRNRSMMLSQLGQLLGMEGVTLYSLQKGEAARQVAALRDGRLVEVGTELRDFADTAAVMSSLDLIVSTDTSVAHLAGALGRPVWVMLQHVPDWRWLLHREDSPWYPTMRLFRQVSPGDWQAVVMKICEALRQGIERT